MSYHINHKDGEKLTLPEILEIVRKYIESIARKKDGSQGYQCEVRKLKSELLLSRNTLEQYGMGHYFSDNSIQL